jgi:predicted nucleic acid-binding protein
VARLVLSDTSPIIGLARVGGLRWLASLFGSMTVTPAVKEELDATDTLEPAIARALEQGWLAVRTGEPSGPRRPPHLGDGEWSTLLAARAHSGPVLVLVDDRLARRECAAAGITVAGTAAVIAMAARRRLVPSARAVFEDLLRTGFRLAPGVIRAALDAAGEGE